MTRWKLPRLRFSLRTFLVLICIIGALLGLAAHRIEKGKQRWAKIAELQRLGVSVAFAGDERAWMPDASSGTTTWQALIHADFAMELEYVDCKTTSPAPRVFAIIRDFPSIKCIKLAGSGADDRIMDELVRHKNVEYLDLSQSRITDIGLARLAELPVLKSIDLPPGIGDEGIIHVAKVPNLLRIRGAGGPITDEGVKHLRGFTGMFELSLRDTQITDKGVAHLAGMTTLMELDLSGTRVTGNCTAYMAGFKNLRRLHLSRSRFNDSGMAGIAGLPVLQDLTLAETDVTDAGMIFLSGPHLLTWLDLSNTKVTPVGLENLTECPELNYLQIRGLPVSDADAPMLAKIPMLLELDCRETGITMAGEALLLKSKVKSKPWVRRW